jgi:glycine/D-amino acid oxidase-like deaminating enzyme
MDLLSSCPFWPIRDGLPGVYPPLERDERCDVAVIGAGISGALAAWHLAQAGIDTVVIDRREVAHGSTAGNTGLVLYETDMPLVRLGARFGPGFARRVYWRCREAIVTLERLVRAERIDCGFERKACLQLAARREHVPRLRREFEARASAGLKVKWWSRARLARESTLPHPAAIWSEPAGQVDAYRLTYGLLAATQRRGGRVYDGTEVRRFRSRGRGVELVTSRGPRIRAREVVVASGYETAGFLSLALTKLHSTYAMVTEPVTSLAGWPATQPVIWDTADPYLYLRTTTDQRILIGGLDEAFRDPAARDRLLTRKTAALQRRLKAFFPRIPCDVAYAWAGTFAATADGLPLIGRHPDVPQAYFALGYGGNGITFSLIAAEIIRDEILGRRDPDAELFGFERG